jgi:sugar phosphate isomerase/epimerase
VLPLSVHMVAWPSTRAGLPAAAALGFGSAEVFALALWGNDPAVVSAWLAAHDITLSAVFLDLPADPRQAADAAARAVAAAEAVAEAAAGPASAPHGFPVTRLIVTANGRSFDEVVAAVAAAGSATAARGVRLCLHPHQQTAVESRAQTEAVLAATDPRQVWVCADTGHLLAAGDDPAAAIAAWAPRLAAVHLKDLDDTGRLVAAGTGRLDLAATLAAIDEAVVAGAPLEHLTVEIEGYDDPGPALAASVAALTGGVRA